ncbi:hypothetical protein [Ruminococcus sp. NK3A76]|uniref:hypothetical protein n=1 Tax=Ruminococcus sp. NK3A76 TaxID=877411 RepID=UPI00048F4590|nr:hypothetical protein [Ruminococcus sp. NK3A76]
MKKLLAIALSFVMSAAMLTACGDDDSSSSKKSKDSSSTSSSAAADSSSKSDDDASDSDADADASSDDAGDADASSDDAAGDDASSDGGDVSVVAEGDGALTKAFSEKMKGGNYTMGMKMNLKGLDMNALMKVDGEDLYMTYDLLGDAEIIKSGDRMVVLSQSRKMYSEVGADEVNEYKSQLGSYTLDDAAQFVSTTEEDGMTVETFNVPLSMKLGEGVTLDSGADSMTEAKYFYDADGNLKKIITDAPILGETTIEITIEITQLSFGDAKIEIPDLSGFTQVDEEGKPVK